MAIILRLDRVMADRKISLKELSEKVGVSNVNPVSYTHLSGGSGMYRGDRESGRRSSSCLEQSEGRW